MKKVLLVSPLRNYPLKNEMYPSGALLLLGTMLRKQGHMVKVVHMVADEVNTCGFYTMLRDFQPDIVAITVSTYQTRYTKAVAHITKAYNRNTIVVAGGAHPTALGTEFLDEFTDVDIAVCGEGEKALSAITKGVQPHLIGGIHYRDSTGVHTTQARQLLTVTQLNALPLPDRNLTDFSKYHGLFPVGRRPSMFIMSSRGCPYHCHFCSRSIYGSTLRLRSPENIMEEVELLYHDWGVREIHFGDDTFNANLSWAHRLLDLMIERGYHKKVVSRVALRVNKQILDTDLLSHLKAAGVWLACFGVENGNQGMLDRMGKGITVEEVKRAFKLTHQAGVKTEAYFIAGMPGETVDTVMQSYDLYREVRPYWGGFSRAMPFPGTELTREAKEAGNLLCEDYDAFGPGCVAVKTDAMTGWEIDNWVNKLNARTRRDKMKHPKQLLYAVKDRLTGGNA